MQTDPNKDLQQIRSMMERSTKFISLSGWTGIFAGIYALLGALAAYFVIYKMKFESIVIPENIETYGSNRPVTYDYQNGLSDLFSTQNLLLLVIAFVVFTLSCLTAIYHSSIKAKKQSLKLWNNTTQRMFVQLAIPMIAGGSFCIALVFYGNTGLIAPAMLIFYGLSLLNGSKYTIKELHSLALLEILLGIISLFFIGYGLLFWAIGFGVLHIIYGIMMQKKYS